MSNGNESVRLQFDGCVARVRFNRPGVLNAIDSGMAKAFRDVCRSIMESPSTRVVVLCGEGRAFMAGGDLARFHANVEEAPQTACGMIDPLHEGIAMLADLPVPVVASIHGVVAGAGASLMLACDLAIAADNLRLTMAYSRIGASLDGSSSWSLPRLVGLRKAMELALLSDILDAHEALNLGLINRVVPAQELEVETEKMVARLAEGPTYSYGKIKRLLRTSFDRNLKDQMHEERSAFCACATTQDFAEALNAFFSRGSPNFKGR